jgi:hypothetical protein
MHPVDFQKVMEQVRIKAPRMVAEMAHYHNGRDEMKLKPAQQETWNNAFSFVECTTPPPAHPVTPDEGLCMEFKLHNKILGIETFWLADTGNLTQDPQHARLVPRGWMSMTALRTELRGKAYDGIRLLKTFLKEKAGVPVSAIYDNLPT